LALVPQSLALTLKFKSLALGPKTCYIIKDSQYVIDRPFIIDILKMDKLIDWRPFIFTYRTER